MSFCTRGKCPHERDVFVWLADGPWLGTEPDDKADPDYGGYPWVHATTMNPGHLEVCRLMPFATPEEAGEVCACGCPTADHGIPTGPIPHAYRPWPCKCGCPDFRHRPEDIEARRPKLAPVVPRPVPALQQAPRREVADVQLDLFGGGAA